MANSFITPTWVVKEVSRIALNNLKFGMNVDRAYSSDFRAGGAKVGASFNLRLPQYRASLQGGMSYGDGYTASGEAGTKSACFAIDSPQALRFC